METKFEQMVSTAASTDVYNIGDDRGPQETALVKKIFWDSLHKVKILRTKSKHRLQLHEIDNFLKTSFQKNQFLQSLTEIPAPVFSIEFSDKDTLTEPYSYGDNDDGFCCPCLLFVNGKEVGEPDDFVFGLYFIKKQKTLVVHSVMGSRLEDDSHGINFIQVQCIHAFLKLVKSRGLDACTYNGPLPDFKSMKTTWEIAKSLLL